MCWSLWDSFITEDNVRIDNRTVKRSLSGCIELVYHDNEDASVMLHSSPHDKPCSSLASTYFSYEHRIIEIGQNFSCLSWRLLILWTSHCWVIDWQMWLTMSAANLLYEIKMISIARICQEACLNVQGYLGRQHLVTFSQFYLIYNYWLLNIWLTCILKDFFVFIGDFLSSFDIFLNVVKLAKPCRPHSLVGQSILPD